MKQKLDAEIIVVGAGPAGASTAYYLAQRGRNVLLLDRNTFPRDKSCGDGVTRSACRLLAEMGVLTHLENARKVRGVRVFMRGQGSRDFEYPHDLSEPNYGLVVPRLELDHKICQQAVAVGAKLWEKALVARLIWENGFVVGVEVNHRGKIKQLRARVVVAANGASSRLVRQAGLIDNSTNNNGFAIRGYYSDIEGLTEFLEIYLPLMDVTDRYLLPSYGWVFPTGPSSANIGVGLFKREHGANVRELFERFLKELHQRDVRFQKARLCGSWMGAPLRFDFSPEHCVSPGFLRVGDAAGLISPFTGEGISYALESGKLAAEAIDRNLHPGINTTPDLSDYSILMENRYTGYFETGRQSARRYILVWHVLESTFQSERPLFVLCRKSVLFPEGIGELHASKFLNDVGPLIDHPVLRIREDLLAVDEVLINILRQDWSFLTRLSFGGRGDPGIPFRPALLLLLAGYFGNPKESQLIQIGAAVELGYLAALAQISVDEKQRNHETAIENRPANWGNMLALMIGDFLLSKAYQLSAEAGSEVSSIIANSLAEACEGRAQEIRNRHNLELTEEKYIDIMTKKIARLFELPSLLGAYLSGASSNHTAALTEYARYLGLAFQLAEDVLALTGQESLLGKINGVDLQDGIYSLSVLLALQQSRATEEQLRRILAKERLTKEDMKTVFRLMRKSGALKKVLKLAQEYVRRAQAALAVLPDNPARLSLYRLAEYAVTREVPEKPDLRGAFD